MRRVSNDPILGRKRKWLGIDMYEPPFGVTQLELASRVPDMQDLTARRLFIQVANNIPPGADGKVPGETRRLCDKALDKLEAGEEANTPYTDLEDTPFGIILTGVDKILPNHPSYGVHYVQIYDKIKEDAEIPADWFEGEAKPDLTLVEDNETD